jgi:MauM/NapG family ferredoxin protein
VPRPPHGDISRKEFLFLMLIPFFLGALRVRKKNRVGGKRAAGQAVIRPPGVLEEKVFLDRCIRCGGCLAVCPTNGLQPAIAESGWEGIWTPRLVPEIGYCAYSCNRCGQVCPTGAIPKLNLPDKRKVRMGTAEVDRGLCLPWSQGRACLICELHCPVPGKAIRVQEGGGPSGVPRPVVDADRCIGCGICQNVCPVRPVRAIRVRP